MATREEALLEIADIMQRHGLTLADVQNALSGSAQDVAQEKSGGVISRLFGYIGGIFIVSGIGTFIAMQWDQLGSPMRVLLTLGVGLCVFVMAVTAAKDTRLTRAATPLFLLAASLEMTGILVTLHEYVQGDNPEKGVMFACLLMLLQQGLTFIGLKRSVLALTTLFFGAGFFGTAFDLLHVNDNLTGAVIGLSLCLCAWAAAKSPHRAIAGIVYFFGSIAFLYASWDALRNSHLDILFMGLACGVIFASTLTRSRALLLVGTLALMGYLGDFIFEHFAHNAAAPIALMLAGILMLALGGVAVRINNKYIRQKA